MKKNIINMKIITVIFCCWISLFARPSHAFVWPTIDPVQITQFITSITKNISKATSFVSGITTTVQQINALGDQISTMLKYIDTLKNAITSIKEGIEGLCEAVNSTISTLAENVQNISNLAQSVLGIEQQNASETVNKVQEDSKDGNVDEEIVNENKAKAETNLNEVKEFIDNAKEQALAGIQVSKDALDGIQDKIEKDETIDSETKTEILEKIENLKQQLDDLSAEISQALDEIKENLDTEYQEKILAAYDKYSEAVAAFNRGEISQEDLAKAGEEFTSSIASTKATVEEDVLNTINQKSEEIIKQIDIIKNDALNALSNSKEYSDEEEVTTTPKVRDEKKTRDEKKISSIDELKRNHKYSFSYKNSIDNSNAKIITINSESGIKSFLTSSELVCYDKTIDDIKKLKTDPTWLRQCVQMINGEEDGENPLLDKIVGDSSNESVEDIERNGIIDHILEDYNAANKITTGAAIQKAQSWRGDVDENSSTYKELNDSIKDAQSIQDSISQICNIDIHAPILWNHIRRVDAVDSAKRVVQLLSSESELLLNTDDVRKSIQNSPGFIEDKHVFPNIMLEHCGLKAEDISVSSDDKYDADKIKSAENNINGCLTFYALTSTLGLDPNSPDEKSDKSQELKVIWRENQKKVLQNSNYDKLVMALIANYNSGIEYYNEPEEEMNIASLQSKLNEATTNKDYYASGAQINYYSTLQLLNVVDADATNLQAEILKNMSQLDFSYFGEVRDEE